MTYSSVIFDMDYFSSHPEEEIPTDIAEKCFGYLPEDLKEALLDFEQWLRESWC